MISPWILVVIVLLIICISYKEGYQNNNHNKDRPDDKQFYACHDYSHDYPGLSNYKVKSHGISEPLEGAYSQFLDSYKLRNYDELYHSPICQGFYVFDDIDNLTDRPIIDSDDLLEQEKLLNQEKLLDEKGLYNPNYLYGNPNHIGNKITYSNKLNELFLKNHHTHDLENIMRKPIGFKSKIVSCSNIDGLNTNFKCPTTKQFNNTDASCILNDMISSNSCSNICCQ